jgi:hypothetical protein
MRHQGDGIPVPWRRSCSTRPGVRVEPRLRTMRLTDQVTPFGIVDAAKVCQLATRASVPKQGSNRRGPRDTSAVRSGSGSVVRCSRSVRVRVSARCARSADMGGCPGSARAYAAGAAGDHLGTTGPQGRPRSPGRLSRGPRTHSPPNRSETRRLSTHGRRRGDRSCSRRARLSGRSRHIHSSSRTLGAGLH